MNYFLSRGKVVYNYCDFEAFFVPLKSASRFILKQYRFLHPFVTAIRSQLMPSRRILFTSSLVVLLSLSCSGKKEVSAKDGKDTQPVKLKEGPLGIKFVSLPKAT